MILFPLSKELTQFDNIIMEICVNWIQKQYYFYPLHVQLGVIISQ
jgi:hypothetical protein